MPEFTWLDYQNLRSYATFYEKLIFSLLIFYAKNVKNTRLLENFCFDFICFHMFDRSPKTLLSKGDKMMQWFKEENLNHVVQLAPWVN